MIGLEPEGWARWVTGRTDVVVRDLLSAEFQVVRRESDVLMRAYAPEVESALHTCSVEKLESLLDVALVSASLEAFRRHLTPSDGS